MSDDDYIFFYPHPDIRNNDIVVNAPSTSRLQHLWDRAKSQEPSIASHIGTAQCTLYVLSDLPTEPDATLFPRSRECLRLHCHDEDKVATRFRQVSKFFPDGPSPDMVHFLSSRKTSLDQLGTIQDQVLRGREQRVELIRTTVPRPSNGASTSAGMRKVVVDNADKFHAGRPAGNYGPPACLFNHALGLVDYRLRHLDDDISEPAPPPILMRMVHQLMTTAARSCSSEDDRVGAMKTLLGKIFSKALHWKPPQGTYGIVPHAINADDPPFVVVEVKNEAGLEGDASLQAGLSYTHIVTAPQFKVRLAYLS